MENKEFAAALVKVQSQIKGAKKDSENPHFRSKYADLASVWDACREALITNGFGVLQHGEYYCDQWVLATTLIHESGASVRGYVPLLNGKGDMQGLGSAMSYARRYGLAAMVGVSPEDDDGNAASEKPKAAKVEAPPQTPQPHPGYDKFVAKLTAAAENGMDALRAAWGSENVDNHRAYMTAVDAEGVAKLKKRAAEVDAAKAAA